MTQDRAAAHAHYDRFIARAHEKGAVFGLKSSDDSWAVCPSDRKTDADVVLVWSERADAARHCQEEWADYRPAKIPLEAFVGEWLKGMHHDGSLVGPDWDASLNGLEVEPVEMARRLVEE